MNGLGTRCLLLSRIPFFSLFFWITSRGKRNQCVGWTACSYSSISRSTITAGSRTRVPSMSNDLERERGHPIAVPLRADLALHIAERPQNPQQGRATQSRCFFREKPGGVSSRVLGLKNQVFRADHSALKTDLRAEYSFFEYRVLNPCV